jgi:hypothetical protein
MQWDTLPFTTPVPAQRNTLTDDGVPEHAGVNRAYLCYAYCVVQVLAFQVEMLVIVWQCLHPDGAAVLKSTLLHSGQFVSVFFKHWSPLEQKPFESCFKNQLTKV